MCKTVSHFTSKFNCHSRIQQGITSIVCNCMTYKSTTNYTMIPWDPNKLTLYFERRSLHSTCVHIKYANYFLIFLYTPNWGEDAMVGLTCKVNCMIKRSTIDELNLNLTFNLTVASHFNLWNNILSIETNKITRIYQPPEFANTVKWRRMIGNLDSNCYHLKC